MHADAQVYVFDPASFDVVLSNAGAMFFDDQNAAFANLRTALKPGGRIVLLVWQVLENNEWLNELRRALAMGRDLPTPPVGTPGPFGLADPDHTKKSWDEYVRVLRIHLPFTGVPNVDEVQDSGVSNGAATGSSEIAD